MAGKGQRFVDAGYKDPKPFIELSNKKRLINAVVDNLTPYEPHRFIFIARKEHEGLIKQHLSFASNVIYVDEVTEGAACTVLLAEKLIDNDEPLLIANSDQLVSWNKQEKVSRAIKDIFWKESNSSQDIINYFKDSDGSCGMATFNSNHPKWSYVELADNGLATRVAEKQVISNEATVGVYYYGRGRHFVSAAKQMIAANDRFNNEFYVAPVFNYLIKDGFHVRAYKVDKMFGLGTPEDLKSFQASLWDGAVFL